MTSESFRGLVLRLRGRTGLTQRELAARAGVNVNSIHGWEAGANFPSSASLKALIAVGLQAGGFTAGHEAEEARELWAAALRNAPRLRMPFDGAWFEQIAAGRREPVRDDVRSNDITTTALPVSAGTPGRSSWGDAPDVLNFVGRASERKVLRQWASDARCRVIAVLGMGGIGKTLLATRVARDLAPESDFVFWRSLRDAPAPGEWLAEAIAFLAPNDHSPPQAESAQVTRLLELLRDARCLLILDNFETVLQPGGSAGDYRPGYERYGTLLRQVAEASHRSCLVVTSREEPLELGPLRGEHGSVRIAALAGLPVEDGRTLLSDKELDGDDAAWQALVERCGGNGLALKVVGETTRELFGGSIADYVEFATETSGVMVDGVRQLLGAQVQRLSELEQEVLRRLAVAREPVGLATLATDLGPHCGRIVVLRAVEGLRRRSLLERSERGPVFGLHSVVLEYVTEQLIEDVAHELASGEPDRLLRQPLLNATAKEYVRRSQERLIVAPLVERLVDARQSARAAEQRLLDLLDQQRGRPNDDQGYGPGNLVNLLRLLRGDLKGADLSGLTIRHAYLQDSDAQGASLATARLSDTVLGEAFNYPTSLALSADGAYLAVGTASGEVCRWRVADRTLLATLPGHVGPAWGVALSGDGRLLASGGVDGTVRLWEAEAGRPLASLPGQTGGVRGVALSGDGRLVASGGSDGTVRLWEAEAGRPLAVLHGHTGEVYSVALSGDGRRLASSSYDGTVRIWETETGRLLNTMNGHAGVLFHVALSRDGRLVAAAGFDGAVRLWDAATGLALATLRGHTGGVRGVALSEDGRLVASGGFDGTVRLWEAEAGRPLATLLGHTGGVYSVALSRDGRLVVSGSLDATVRLWDAEAGRPLATLRGHTTGAYSVALGHDGRLVVSGSLDGTVRLWDSEAGRPLATLRGHTGEVYAAALGRDGRLVASGGLDGTVRLWDAEDGRPLATLHGHIGGVYTVALGADGRLVVSGGADGTVRLWEAEGGRLLATLRGHAGGVWSVAVRADGRLVASSGDDGTVRLWDASSGALRRVLRAERRYEALDITGLTGITDAQRGTLFALGAIERRGQSAPSN
jgi:WD40 repeat protein/transcriptional regulator with XRE-family HTH domain